MLKRVDFAGHWTLTRQIEDRTAGPNGQFVGTAVFEAIADATLRYTETGTLQLGQGPSMTAERSYLWEFAADRVDVFFDDGRDFHHFVPDGVSEGSNHPCGEDFYTVTYDFTVWPNWVATWTVTGPRKDYTSVTRYQPA